ncbi:MAG: sigma 54-interacting transcriptional regulator, partial [Deltaproteobacteria bacterium]|nr:sigma 54-interacting transcriptional regulator [Deltaproteobacteria bacterium]
KNSTVLSDISRRFETYSPEMKRMLEEVAIAADKDVTMLLIGETGSGKTYLSNLIHEVSPRLDEPFITVACGSLPGDLIESETVVKNAVPRKRLRCAIPSKLLFWKYLLLSDRFTHHGHIIKFDCPSIS